LRDFRQGDRRCRDCHQIHQTCLSLIDNGLRQIVEAGVEQK